MHESERTMIEEPNQARCSHGDNALLFTEAIQNQAELDALRKKLEICLEEKTNLERKVNFLAKELEEKKSLDATRGLPAFELLSASVIHSIVHLDDQLELKTMVDVIAAASQREAEARERSTILSKENDSFRMKIKELINDNNKLLELYDQATAEKRESTLVNYNSSEEQSGVYGFRNHPDQEVDMKETVENLERQLKKIHEKNEKLMTLYEKAMYERDDFKRMLSDDTLVIPQMAGEFICPNGEGHESRSGVDCSDALLANVDPNSQSYCEIRAEVSMEETSLLMKRYMSDGVRMLHERYDFTKKLDHEFDGHSPMEIDCSENSDYHPHHKIDAAKFNLERVQEKLEASAENFDVFHSIQKVIVGVDEMTNQLLEMEDPFHVIQKNLKFSKQLSLEARERVALDERKFTALRYSLSSFAASMTYLEQREAQERARMSASSFHLEQKSKTLARVMACKQEVELVLMKNQQAEEELKDKLVPLKLKFEEEQRKRESEKVLFPIENEQEAEKKRVNWRLDGKATELLKLEEEKPKLLTEINFFRERICSLRKESAVLLEKLVKMEGEMKSIDVEVKDALRKAEEIEAALQAVVQEKENVLEMIKDGKREIESMVLCYYEQVLERDLKEVETADLEEELGLSEAMGEELGSVVDLIREANSFLSKDS